MYAEVDKDLADVNGNTAAWRLSEQKPFFAGMGNDMAKTMFYGDIDVEPDKFMGLSARYNDTSSTTPSSRNVIKAVSTGATTKKVTSIFIVSMDQFFGIYPKGSKIGLQHTDKGQCTHMNSDGSMYESIATTTSGRQVPRLTTGAVWFVSATSRSPTEQSTWVPKI